MNAVDCHVHLCDPGRFPYRAGTLYTPGPHETATHEDLARTMAAGGTTHAVLVGPMAGYQSDNSCLLDGLAHGAGRFRGIAIVEADVADLELDRLAKAGVVGARIDLVGRGTEYLSGEGAPLLARLAARGWIVDLQCEGDQLAAHAQSLTACGARIVVDHAGRPDPTRGLDQPGFAALRDLARTGRCWVKLSGPFRFAREVDWADARPYLDAILASFGPARCVWGSDWPFLRLNPRPSYADTRKWLDRLVPDAAGRARILWDTPAALFGFAQ
ncbi:MAG: amidohydrolase family protein [Tagaea sp.]|nr:amidohydrolase family protein [Tagaea sp.]